MNAPQTFTLYRFYDETDVLLYIGLTVNPGRRMEKHRGDKPWWNDVARIAMEQHDDLAALRAAERTAITTEKPLYNVRMNGTNSSPPKSRRNHYLEESSIDGLVGRFFHSFRDEAEEDEHATRINGRRVHWQGHIVQELRDDLYMIELFSWMDGDANGRRLIRIDDMLDWQFYDSSLEMQVALPCGTYHDSSWTRCRGERAFFAEIPLLGIHLICNGCRKRYPGYADYKPLIWRDGRPHLS